MDIIDYAQQINRPLVIRMRPHAKREGGRWYCSFEDSDIARGERGLLSQHGNGATPVHAIEDYARLIRGETLVLDAMNDKYRREYHIPEDLTFDPLRGVRC